ncbi:low-density lipoprotein receptor class A domain-containing protein 2 [Carettochelys insculpta]|uniref:low-density lipoprotein receptor class A domain-containing protein 2 n=1 Tax=Carettochelys insculpta TaxID=44489 RepID=UPI003EC0D878
MAAIEYLVLTEDIDIIGIIETWWNEDISLVDFCGQAIRDDGLVLKAHRDSLCYYFAVPGMDCSLTMQAASPQDKVHFQFRFLLVYSLLPPGPGHPLASGDRELPDPCGAGSYLQFYDGPSRTAKPLGAPLCGMSVPWPVLSTGTHLTLRLVTWGRQPRVDFVGDFTSVQLGECHQELYFQCWNGTCSPPSLVCDQTGVDNCGDGSDQAAQCTGHTPTAAARQPVRTPAAAPTLHAMGKSQTWASEPRPQAEPAAGARLPELLALYRLPGLVRAPSCSAAGRLAARGPCSGCWRRKAGPCGAALGRAPSRESKLRSPRFRRPRVPLGLGAAQLPPPVTQTNPSPTGCGEQ